MTSLGEDGSSKNRWRKPVYRMTSSCPSCEGALVLRESRLDGGKFVGCENFPDCKFHESFDTRYQEVLTHCHEIEAQLRAFQAEGFELPPADAVEESLSEPSIPWCSKCDTFHDATAIHARRPDTPRQERLDEPIDDEWFEEAYFSGPFTARQFLLSFLAEGPKTTEVIFVEGRKHGFQPERLREVRREIGLITNRKPGTRTWLWSLAKEGKVS